MSLLPSNCKCVHCFCTSYNLRTFAQLNSSFDVGISPAARPLKLSNIAQTIKVENTATTAACHESSFCQTDTEGVSNQIILSVAYTDEEISTINLSDVDTVETSIGKIRDMEGHNLRPSTVAQSQGEG